MLREKVRVPDVKKRRNAEVLTVAPLRADICRSRALHLLPPLFVVRARHLPAHDDQASAKRRGVAPGKEADAPQSGLAQDVFERPC